MAVEVRHSGKSMEQRVDDRLKPSGDQRADVHTQQGSGPTRVHHFIHNAGHVVFPETRARESGPQEQRYASAATTQDLTAYKQGKAGLEDE
jgi:hypothetical protein